jgi:hypothetical protein
MRRLGAMPIIESWKFEVDGLTVSRDGAHGAVHVEVQERGSGQPSDDAPPPRARVQIPIDAWQELVAAVAQKLSTKGAQR